MRRLYLGCLLPIAFLALIVAIIGGGAYLISDGQILNDLQLLVLRVQLNDRQIDLHTPYGSDSQKIRFRIKPGADATGIALDLQTAELIVDAQLFVDYARIEGLDRRFEAGTYFLSQSQSIAEIAPLLTDSSSSYIPFRSLEGARIEEAAQLVDGNELFSFVGANLLQLVEAGAQVPIDFAEWASIPAGASLEGYLFPDTYQLPPDVTALGFRDTLLQTFRERVGDQLQRDAAAQGLTLHQAVTLASIIEREAVWRDEHAKIASVYRNRLALGMSLEADPTVQYGLDGKRETWWPNITRADYRQVDSPYNTYLHGGLPPGPIASPSLSAIRGAIYPADTAFLYFRAACDGSYYHNFAMTFDEHVNNGC